MVMFKHVVQIVIILFCCNGLGMAQCTEEHPIAEFEPVSYPIDVDCDYNIVESLYPLYYTNNGPSECLIEGFVDPVEMYAPNTVYIPYGKRFIYSHTDDRGNTIETEVYITFSSQPSIPVFTENPTDITVDCRNIPFPELFLTNNESGNCEQSGYATKSIEGSYNCESGGIITQKWRYFYMYYGWLEYSRNVTILPDPNNVQVLNADLIVEGRIITSVQNSVVTNNIIKPERQIMVISGSQIIDSINHGMDGQHIKLIGGINASFDFSQASNVTLSPSNTSMVLEENDVMGFVYVASTGKWIQVSYSDN